MRQQRFVLPFVLPVAAFAAVILVGSLLLWLPGSAADKPVAYVDALFIATSSVCVTGLSTVDITTVFSRTGHVIMMVLVQLGGLGITTYSTLIFYLWSRRISLTDRMAVGDALLNDSTFHLGRFLQRIVVVILLIEASGALLLHAMEPERISVFSAVFLAISAFCNAGFALWSDNLVGWQRHVGVNAVVMALIVCGGLGFAVIDECLRVFRARWKAGLAGFGLRRPRAFSLEEKRIANLPRLSGHARLVFSTSAFLIVGGAILLLLAERFANDMEPTPFGELILPSLFQSVTARTAGFNSMSISGLTDVSLLVLIALMLIGGSPGSCAGGIKTTSFRVLVGFIGSQLRGRSQVMVRGKAMDHATLNKMFVLVAFVLLTVLGATFVLTLTEGGASPHGKTPFQVLDLLFESASAFATVGLSTDVSPRLSTAGKLIDCLLMFIGRLGPVWLLTTLQQLQTEPGYRYPETMLPIG